MLGKELSYGWRRLRQRPGFTLTALLILGLGIGANTAIFSLLDAVALRPLPYREPDRMVKMWATAPDQGIEQIEVSFTKFRALREHSRQLAAVTVYYDDTFNLTESGSPESLDGERISKEFFDVWGIAPVLGRRFTDAEDAKGGADVLLLSQGYWQRRFGRDPHVVGKTLHLEGRPFQVIGVMPEVLRFPFKEIDLWLPRAQEFGLLPEAAIEKGASYLQAAARLKPGVSLETARTEAEQISQNYDKAYPDYTDARFNLKVVPLNDELVGSARKALLLLLGAVGLVLVIACADMASLLLVQGLARHRELAIRIAVGASREQLVRQMIVEGVLLSLLGGALGLLLAYYGLRLLVALQPADLPRLDQVGLDSHAFLFAAFVSLLTGVLFSLAPAFQTLRTEASAQLRGSLQKPGSKRRSPAQGMLVIAEVALALTLLIGAGLLVASFRRLLSVDVGFDPQKLITMKISLPASKYPDVERQRLFFTQMLDNIRALPGVSAAAVSDFLPVQGTARSPFHLEGHPPATPQDEPLAWRMVVSPGYFHTLGAKLVRGRDFPADAAPDSPMAVVINESMVKQYFPNEDALGKRLVVRDKTAEIIGVAKDIQQLGLEVKTTPQFYISSRQIARPAPFMQLLVRTSLPPENVSASVRRTVLALDSEQPVGNLQTLEGIISTTLAPRRLTVGLLTGFSVVALVLCLLGLYGVLAHTVTSRTQEISVRMALGARPGQVLSLVVGQGLKWVVSGIVLGLLAALALTRVLQSWLFEVSAHEPTWFVAAPVLLAVVGLFASWLPARRASRIAPARALKEE
jgi:putative ABC transport system permease protein